MKRLKKLYNGISTFHALSNVKVIYLIILKLPVKAKIIQEWLDEILWNLDIYIKILFVLFSIHPSK